MLDYRVQFEVFMSYVCDTFREEITKQLQYDMIVNDIIQQDISILLKDGSYQLD